MVKTKNTIQHITIAAVLACGQLAYADNEYADVRFTAVTVLDKFKHERAEFAPQLENIMPWLTAGGAGVSVGDYNNDGLDDIYLTTSLLGKPNHLYRNEGNFKFTEVATELGIGNVNADIKQGTSSFSLWLDYDQDGWQDLFLLRFGMTSLFHNEQGKKFTEVTEQAGVLRRTNSLSAIAFDYDNDGDLDIYIGGYFPEKDFHSTSTDTKVLFESWEEARNAGRNYLFQNDGKGRFTDVTAQANVDDHGWAMAVGHADINNDGWQDLYIANDFGTDIVFKNNGDGTFSDISKKAIGVDTKKGMNTEFGDYNDDGWVDVYVTNMTQPYLHECNMLWKNNANETFTDISQETNSCDTDWGWGAKFADFNNDGLQDLYVANGFISAGAEDYMDVLLEFIFEEDVDLRDAEQWPKMGGHSMAGYERNYLLMQTAGSFSNIAAAAGVDSIKDSRGVAVADFDSDGKVDIVVSSVDASPDFYRNTSTSPGNWLLLKVLATGKMNRDAIGARVAVHTDNKIHYREVQSASGFNAQSSMRLHVGLGTAKSVNKIVITWPNGETETFAGVAVNAIYQLQKGGKITELK